MTNTVSQNTAGKMNDLFVERKNMKPFWLFADQWDGLYTKGKYVCILGTHYPSDLWDMDVSIHQKCVERMNNGAWKLEELQTHPDTKIGYGFGRTPSEAFRLACYSAGYLKKEVT